MHPFFRYTCASIMRSPVISRRSSMAETCSFGICSQRYHVTSFFALIGRWGGVRLMDDRVEVVIGIEEEVHRLQPARQLGKGETGEKRQRCVAADFVPGLRRQRGNGIAAAFWDCPIAHIAV